MTVPLSNYRHDWVAILEACETPTEVSEDQGTIVGRLGRGLSRKLEIDWTYEEPQVDRAFHTLFAFVDARGQRPSTSLGESADDASKRYRIEVLFSVRGLIFTIRLQDASTGASTSLAEEESPPELAATVDRIRHLLSRRQFIFAHAAELAQPAPESAAKEGGGPATLEDVLFGGA